MRPAPGEVLHFSDDPAIDVFAPHRAATAQPDRSFVWAVDAGLAQGYWFPRQCPRAMAWAVRSSRPADVRGLLGSRGARVHAVERGWLQRMRDATLYAYRLPARPFRPLGAPPYAYVGTETVRPLGPPERVGDLLALHRVAGIELRVLHTLWPSRRAVVGSSLGFRGIRLRNAGPREGYR
jgi:hypothetical protein